MVRAVPLPKSRKAILRRILEITVAMAFVGYLAWTVAGRWAEVRGVIGELSPVALALSTVAALAAFWCSFLSWRVVLADFGSDIPLSGGMRIFFIGQLGKYLPGKVWPVVTQARLGRTYQVPGRASAAAALLVMLISLGAALLLTAVLLPFLGGKAFDRYWWTLLALPVAAVALWPPVLNRILAHAMRLARRESMPRQLSLAGISRSVGWALLSWLLFGVHLWVLLSDLAGPRVDLLLPAIGAFAGSWAIGFLLSVAPAGVGPRELALTALLGAAVSEPAALVAAIVSRVLMTLTDLVWPVVAVLVERRWQRSRRGAVPDPDSTAAAPAELGSPRPVPVPAEPETP